jgi:hypothetical protein
MWKKQDDAAGTALEFTSKPTPESTLESVGEALMGVYLDSQSEKGKSAVGPQAVVADVSHHPSTTATMAAYTEAVNEFTRNATAFIEQLPLLTKARDSYEQAMRARAELREVLDAGEKNLRTLVTQLEQAVNVYGVKPAPDKKNPQPAKVEAITGTDESSGRIMTRFP